MSGLVVECAAVWDGPFLSALQLQALRGALAVAVSIPPRFPAGAGLDPVLALALQGGLSATIHRQDQHWLVVVDTGCLYRTDAVDLKDFSPAVSTSHNGERMLTLFDCMGVDANTVRVSFSPAVGIEDPPSAGPYNFPIADVARSMPGIVTRRTMRVQSADDQGVVDQVVRLIGNTVQFIDRAGRPSAARVLVHELPTHLRRVFPSLPRRPAISESGTVWIKAPGSPVIKELPETAAQRLRRATPASSVIYGNDQPPSSRAVCHLWSDAGAVTLYTSTEDNGRWDGIVFDGFGGALVMDEDEMVPLVGACTR